MYEPSDSNTIGVASGISDESNATERVIKIIENPMEGVYSVDQRVTAILRNAVFAAIAALVGGISVVYTLQPVHSLRGVWVASPVASHFFAALSVVSCCCSLVCAYVVHKRPRPTFLHLNGAYILISGVGLLFLSLTYRGESERNFKYQHLFEPPGVILMATAVQIRQLCLLVKVRTVRGGSVPPAMIATGAMIQIPFLFINRSFIRSATEVDSFWPAMFLLPLFAAWTGMVAYELWVAQDLLYAASSRSSKEVEGLRHTLRVHTAAAVLGNMTTIVWLLSDLFEDKYPGNKSGELELVCYILDIAVNLVCILLLSGIIPALKQELKLHLVMGGEVEMQLGSWTALQGSDDVLGHMGSASLPGGRSPTLEI